MNFRIELTEEDLMRKAFKLRLDLLEKAHLRACTPKQRRQVERMMVEVKREFEEFERSAAELEKAAAALELSVSLMFDGGENDNGHRE